MIKDNKANQGSSLLEVVTAVAVTVLALIALVRLTTLALGNADFARRQAAATKLAGEVRERLREYRESHVWSDFEANCANPAAVGYALDAESDQQFNLLPPVVCTCADNACDVTITVSWSDAKGTHKSELVTKFTNWR